MKWHKHKFSTIDSENDSQSAANCAWQYFGGWWFADCYSTHLNGKYYSGGKMAFDTVSDNILIATGIHWSTTGFNGGSDSLIFVEMKVRILSKIFVTNIKNFSLNWNLVLRLIRIYRIQWWCSLFPFSIGKTCFWQ